MQKEIYFEKLENIYSQFVSQDIISSFKNFYKIICKEFGFLKPIKADKRKELSRKTLLYRGVGDDNNVMMNLVIEPDPSKFYVGDGVFGMGIYCTKNFKTALQYAEEEKQNVIKLYLEKCNMVDYWDIDSLKKIILNKYCGEVEVCDDDKKRLNRVVGCTENVQNLFEFLDKKGESAERQKFIYYLLSNVTNIAAILEFDAAELSSKYKAGHFDDCSYVIFNRSKLSIGKRFHKVLERCYKENKELENEKLEEKQKI